MIKAVIFDMFETLVSLFDGRTYFNEDIAEDIGLPKAEFRKVWHDTEHGRTVGEYTIAQALALCFDKFGAYTDDNVQLAVQKRRESLDDSFGCIPDETFDMLEKLHEKGIKLGLITNAFSDECEVIKSCRLYPYFDAAVISYEQGICKPDRAVFDKAVDMLGVYADECLYVGDGGSGELYAARDIGMHAVQAVWYSSKAYEPHIPCPPLDGFVHIEKQSDIPDIVESYE